MTFNTTWQPLLPNESVAGIANVAMRRRCKDALHRLKPGGEAVVLDAVRGLISTAEQTQGFKNSTLRPACENLFLVFSDSLPKGHDEADIWPQSRNGTSPTRPGRFLIYSIGRRVASVELFRIACEGSGFVWRVSDDDDLITIAQHYMQFVVGRKSVVDAREYHQVRLVGEAAN